MKIALVTGASGGIGSEIARRLAEEGWGVALHYFESYKKAQALEEELGRGRALAVGADLAASSQIDKMVEQVMERFGRVDLLVNNAGTAQRKLLTDVELEEWDRLFAIHVRGAFLLTKAVLPQMISRQSGQIINISSIWGLVGGAMETPYSAAKAALIGFTKALAKEVGPSGVQVNCVAPGVIETAMNDELDDEALDLIREETPLGCIGEPRDVAEAVCYLASSKGRFMTGQVLSPNGGMVI